MLLEIESSFWCSISKFLRDLQPNKNNRLNLHNKERNFPRRFVLKIFCCWDIVLMRSSWKAVVVGMGYIAYNTKCSITANIKKWMYSQKSKWYTRSSQNYLNFNFLYGFVEWEECCDDRLGAILLWKAFACYCCFCLSWIFVIFLYFCVVVLPVLVLQS